jgi:hypothetical protein
MLLVAALLSSCSTAPAKQTVKPLATPSRSIGVGATLVIEPPAAEYVIELDQRERREQVRDWAVLAAIGHFSTTPEQAAAATYELPPARLPYLDELYTFEYGRGRRAYLGNRVLLLRDADDPDPQTTIGRLADRVRMENGEIPVTVEVYLVHDRRDDGQITIERGPDVAGAALFSLEYGYVEGEGRDPQQLAAWLEQADDLSFARVTSDGRLVLGGRRFAHTRTPNLTVEDVAALYQAHEKLDEPRAGARAQLEWLPADARGAAARVAELAAAGKLTETAQIPGIESLERAVPEHRLRDVVQAAAMLNSPSPSPGFSLDPEWLPDPENPGRPALRAALHRFASDPCGDLRTLARQARDLVASEPDETRRTWRAHLAAITVRASGVFDVACKEIKEQVASEVERVATALDEVEPNGWSSALVPYHELTGRLAGSKSLAAKVATLALWTHEADSEIQCARYEGTAGTRVGMTLFYTDLLAKLWESTDYGLSAPVLEVPGFLTAPRIDLPPEFRDEMKRNPGTRLWFGPRTASVSRIAGRDEVGFAFDHRFSRIYAAGTNPARPGREEQPPEDSRRTLGWWDRHFDAVADFEPQYHLQNQIMKWTMVTAALTGSTTAHYLHTTEVTRGLRFAEWQRANRMKLRFADSLPAAHATIASRECIPIIASYDSSSTGTSHYIAGGVSTVAREAPTVMKSIDIARPLGARKPFIADLGAGKAGTATRAHAVQDGARVTFADAERAQTIGARGAVELGSPEVVYTRGATPTTLVIKARGNAAISELSIEPVPGKGVPGATEHLKLSVAIGEGDAEASLATATIKDGDAAAQSGNFFKAARIYDKTVSVAHSADDIGRLAHVDVAHARPAPLLQKLQQLERAPASPVVNESLLQELRRLETPAVARRVEAMMKRHTPLNGNHEVVSVVDHELVVTRDITVAEAAPARRAVPTDLSEHHVYIDDRILAAREGLLPEVGRYVARWRRIRGVQIEELEASKIGALPDRLRESDGSVFKLASPRDARRATTASHPRIFMIRQCAATNDNQDGDAQNVHKQDDLTKTALHGC